MAARHVDWLLLLEDDVWLCNKIKNLPFDMNGQCTAHFKEYWGEMAPGKCYGGYGGFVLRSSFLRRMQINKTYIHQILLQLKRPIASDELISALFLKMNATVGKIPEYAEKMSLSPTIVHQMKGFYKINTEMCNLF